MGIDSDLRAVAVMSGVGWATTFAGRRSQDLIEFDLPSSSFYTMLWWFWVRDPACAVDFCASTANELSSNDEQFERVLESMLRGAASHLPDHITRADYASMRVRVYADASRRGH